MLWSFCGLAYSFQLIICETISGVPVIQIGQTVVSLKLWVYP